METIDTTYRGRIRRAGAGPRGPRRRGFRTAPPRRSGAVGPPAWFPLVAATLATALFPALGAMAMADEALFSGGPQPAHARASLVSETGALTPGAVHWLALRLRMDEGWHIYWNGRNDTGYPPALTLDLPPGFRVGEIQWPAPSRYISPGEILDHVYALDVALLVPVHAPADLPPGRPVTLRGLAEWLICSNACIPESARVELTLPVVAAAEPVADAAPSAANAAAAGPRVDTAAVETAEVFARARARLPVPLSTAGPTVRLEWRDRELRVHADGARGLSYFPGERSARLAHPIKDAETDGDRLILRFDPEDGTELLASGVLEVRAGEGARRWYAFDSRPAGPPRDAPSAIHPSLGGVP